MTSVAKAIGASVVAAAAAYILSSRLSGNGKSATSSSNKSGGSQMRVVVKPDKQAVGKASAEHVAAKVSAVIEAKGYARVIFATGASQFEFIEELLKLSVRWDKVTCFHLDEYVGLRLIDVSASETRR